MRESTSFGGQWQIQGAARAPPFFSVRFATRARIKFYAHAHNSGVGMVHGSRAGASYFELVRLAPCFLRMRKPILRRSQSHKCTLSLPSLAERQIFDQLSRALAVNTWASLYNFEESRLRESVRPMLARCSDSPGQPIGLKNVGLGACTRGVVDRSTTCLLNPRACHSPT